MDVDRDGDWELAITLADVNQFGHRSNREVGIFDPMESKWLVGPDSLHVDGSNWEVLGSLAGGITYVYLSGQDIRSFDPRTGRDSALWSVQFTPTAILLEPDASEHVTTVALLRNGGGTSPISFTWSIHDLATGTPFGSFAGGVGTPRRVRTDRNSEMDAVAIVACWGRKVSSPEGMGLAFTDLWAKIDIYGDDWIWRDGTALPALHRQYNTWFGMQTLQSATSSWDNVGNSTVVCYTTPSSPGIDTPYYLVGRGGTNWVVSFHAQYGGSLHKSVAAFDLDEDGAEELILPFAYGNGWELRDPTNGQIIDTLHDLPSVYLYSGPFAGNRTKALLYSEGSSLNVLTHSLNLDDDGSAKSRPGLLLSAYPNPFNSSAVLTWDTHAQGISLTIHNILGQTVRSFDESDLTSESTVTWDGLDGRGRPVASGVYFARLVTRDQVATAKLVMLR